MASSDGLVGRSRKRDGSMRLFVVFFGILFVFGSMSILLPHTALLTNTNDGSTTTIMTSNFLLPHQDSRNSIITHQKKKKKSSVDVDDNNIIITSNSSGAIPKLAGLTCGSYGGPADDIAQEMVYWEDIPSDSTFVSPFYQKDTYLTFEADAGGWNNIRMAMETVLALAVAMGRTLVLPPEKEMYLLKKTTGQHGKQQKTTFSFNDFFHMDKIHHEHVGLDIITMQEFLETVAMTGQLVDVKTGRVTYPPDRITNWDGRNDIDRLNMWLRSAGLMADWNPEQCIGAFPTSTKPQDLQSLQEMEQEILASPPKWSDYQGKPIPVDAQPLDRLKENWAERKKLCLYDTKMQQAKVVHFAVDHSLHLRLLVHFYAFVFFQNYQVDLWLKRFIRDHVRYADEIQCAAARVVAALRSKSIRKNQNGFYDAFHVRRGDFQYTATRVEARILVEMAQRNIPNGTLLYMATDERNKAFFDPLKEYYDLVFLDDFHDEALMGVNTNYYGMIDQLVATRSRTFYGCWFSTFTGYINRLRGYHADEEEQPGYKEGILKNSWYYVLPDRYDHMQEYYPVKKSFFAREFPTSWRLIDTTYETS